MLALHGVQLQPLHLKCRVPQPAALLQVCSYRCIVSHETPKLQDFTLCILQRHNCLGLAAPIPSQPAVSPMAAWRGSPLTHAAAEDIFIGWLGVLPCLPAIA